MTPMSALFALPATIMQDQAQAVADNLTSNMAQLAAADKGGPSMRLRYSSLTPQHWRWCWLADAPS